MRHGFTTCDVRGCTNKVRVGLVRPSWERGAEGQRLADGRTCSPCRLKEARRDGQKRAFKKVVSKMKNAFVSTGWTVVDQEKRTK